MADIPVIGIFGVDQTTDETRLKEGFLRKIKGARLRADDRDRLWKLSGRTLAGTLPSTTNVKGLLYLKHSRYSTAEILVGATNGYLYEEDAGTSLPTWNQVWNQDDDPFPFTGSNPKAIPDGNDSWIVWSGASESPLIRDNDATWRRLGLAQPNRLVLSSLLTSQTAAAPDAHAAGPTSGSDQLDSPTNAYDSDDGTFAYKLFKTIVELTPDYVEQVFSFTDAGNTPAGGLPLFVKLGVDYLGGGDELDYEVNVYLSTNGGTSYVAFYESGSIGKVDFATTVVSTNLPGSTAWSNIKVLVQFIVNENDSLFFFTSGNSLEFRVYEVWAQAGAGTAIDAGTYNYAITECLRTAQDNQVIESPASEVLSVTPDGSTEVGIVLTLPTVVNNESAGCDPARMFFRLYRSTKTGTYPDLGLIAEIPITETTFTDNFDTYNETTLGSPTIPSLSVGGVAIEYNSPPPAFLDATLYKGAIVAIPFNDSDSLVWSMPGNANAFPVSHEFTFALNEKGDRLAGVVAFAVGTEDALILLFRNHVERLVNLPFADNDSFNVNEVQRVVLNPTNGLAAGNKGYAFFPGPAGTNLLAWVSDNGIWVTDAGLRTERAAGSWKITTKMDWSDVDSLSTARLTFDPIDEILWFDYDSVEQGQRVAVAFHVDQNHWYPDDNQNYVLPAFTGPHDQRILMRASGEVTGSTTETRRWSIEESTGKIFNESVGEEDVADWFDAAGNIDTLLQSGWVYPAGPNGEFLAYQGHLWHSNWGKSVVCQVVFETRKDIHGNLNRVVKDGVSLTGSRITPFWLSRGGQAFRLTLRHTGQATGAFGPLMLDAEPTGVREGD